MTKTYKSEENLEKQANRWKNIENGLLGEEYQK